MLGLLKFRIEFLADGELNKRAKDDNQDRKAADLGNMVLQEQACHMQALIHYMSVSAGTSLNAFDYDKEANEALLALVEQIEVLLNGMLMLNFPNNNDMSFN